MNEHLNDPGMEHVQRALTALREASSPGQTPEHVESALLQGVSRFRDPGRGQGLAGIKRYLQRWQGKISVRSGTARIAIVPAWDDDAPLVENLPFFPGAQLQVTIPAQDPEKA